MMFSDCRLETLDKLFNFCKNSGDSFFIFEWLDNTKIVQKLFKDWIYNILAYLGVYSLQSLPWLMGIIFFYDTSVKVGVYPLFNDLQEDSVIFISFPYLGSSSRFKPWIIYYIPDFFLFQHDLSQISSLWLVFETTELLTFAFSVIVFISQHFNSLEENKNVVILQW